MDAVLARTSIEPHECQAVNSICAFPPLTWQLRLSACSSVDNSASHYRKGNTFVAAKRGSASREYPSPRRMRKEEEEASGFLPELDELSEVEMETVLGLQLQSAFDSPPRHYEMMFLIHEKYDEEVAAVIAKIKDAVEERRGKIWRLNDWGMRELAYKIKKAKRAHYVLMNVELPANKIDEIGNILMTEERIIRHLIMKTKAEVTEDCPPPPMYNAGKGAEEDVLEEELEDDDEDEDEEYESEVEEARAVENKRSAESNPLSMSS
eukprot:TRINITY_DN1988_c0_g1_i2.p1 TRINITY_DN1988_c0_g1~~TRINITY_DN1988_c0_g1_i2.p1  ORF type:complete len:279 (-),score=71.87 TRINITY_DN1988_c0_g1_i2:292-1086(-)